MDLLQSLLGVLIIALGIGLSIGLHEFGHFYPAKKFGIYVGKFMVGFGPTIWSRQFGETEFGIKLIPLGGYVALSGMYPPTASTNKSFILFRKLVQDARDASAETITDDSRAFYRLGIFRRIIVMLGGPFMNLVIAAVLYLWLFAGFGIIAPTTTIGTVADCVRPVTSADQTCSPTDPVAPAAVAGLKAGDRIVSVDGKPFTDWTTQINLIRQNPNKPMTFVVERDGTKLTKVVTPIATERYKFDTDGNPILDESGQYRTEVQGYAGISSVYERQTQSPAAAMVALGKNIVDVGTIIIDLPDRMLKVWEAAFGPTTRDSNGPVSVVGVGRIAGEIAGTTEIDLVSRLAALVGILASLNVALFVFNLIPLLPLDGGHIAIALIDWVRNGIARIRKKPAPTPLDTAKLVPITIVATAILIGMSALLIYADIVKPITLGP